MHTSLSGLNALDPSRMSPADRFAEIGAILAAGVLRLRAAKSSSLSANGGDSCLDFPADQRRHADTRMKKKA